jgi:glycosyltransferase involved in cell wall biosynthesis
MLHIIGNAQDKKYVASLHLLVKSLHIEKKVIFHGFLEAEKYYTLLKNARCMIVPSQKEGYGLVVIEANAYGLPVIAYDVAGLRDSVKPEINGVLVQDGNIEDMARAIREMFANEESYRILAEKSLNYAKNVPKWSDQVQKFENIIQSS